MKRGKGPIIMKTVSGTIFILFVTTVHSIIDATGRGDAEPGKLNPTDQIIMVRHLLDSSLMGFILFLELMIDRLHQYIRELGQLRKTMEVSKKQQTRTFDDGGNKKKNNGSMIDDNDVTVANSMADQITALKNQVEKLENVCAAKSDEAKSADAKAEALKKQCDELLMEYDRLLEDNQALKTQLREIHRPEH